MTCETQEDCTGPGTECIMHFCQPGNCTATGQCAYGFVCSQFGTCLRKKIIIETIIEILIFEKISEDIRPFEYPLSLVSM